MPYSVLHYDNSYLGLDCHCLDILHLSVLKKTCWVQIFYLTGWRNALSGVYFQIELNLQHQIQALRYTTPPFIFPAFLDMILDVLGISLIGAFPQFVFLVSRFLVNVGSNLMRITDTGYRRESVSLLWFAPMQESRSSSDIIRYTIIGYACRFSVLEPSLLNMCTFMVFSS